MANFATASDALTAALAIVDARLRNIDINEQLELYIELVDRRAKIQAAIGASGGGGGGGVASTVTANAGTNLNTSLLAIESGGNLAGINNKLPILGPALAAASTPVVLTAAQITILTPLSSVGISGTLPPFTAPPTFNLGTAPNLTFTNTAFIVNAGTNLNTSLLAFESGGNLAGINTRIGEVQATPTANTLLSRLKSIEDELAFGIKVADTQTDIHGQVLGVCRITQVTAKFFQQAPANFLNISASGGATATGPTLGLGVFATGSGSAASSLLAQTPTTVMYSTAYEAWASQAAVFTTPATAASFQRLGIYDAVNGYFFGFSGLTFGLTIRSNSVDTFIPKASWNVDALTGAVGSKFTSNNVPVALVPTNINMYRVRYGWYGAVPARLEIFSPDGDWVLVHMVRTANTQATANITNPDLPMTLEVSKPASDLTNLRISCGGWAAGVTAPSLGVLISGQGSIAALNAFVAVPVTGVAALSYAVTGNWVGTLIFQYSLDGLTWYTDATLNTVTGAFLSATTTNGSFTASIGSYKFYRIVATAWTSGTASIVYNGSASSNFVVAQLPQLPSTLGINTAVNSLPVVIASNSVLQPPPTFTASTVCLTTALVEGSIALTSAKILAMESRTSTAFRLSTTSGNTINTQNFEAVLAGREYYQDGINFTGSFFFSAETLPTPVTVLACATSNNNSNVTSANSFSAILIGQAVTGTNIPANTFVIARASNGLAITLGNAAGATVNATANGSVTLIFSGAVIRISRWT